MNSPYAQPASASNTAARRQLVLALLAAASELREIATAEELLRFLPEALAALRVAAGPRRLNPSPAPTVIWPDGREGDF